MENEKHYILKNLLDKLGDFDKKGDIYSYLAEKENLQIIEQLDLILNFFEDALMKIPTLRKSFEKQDGVKEAFNKSGDMSNG